MLPPIPGLRLLGLLAAVALAGSAALTAGPPALTPGSAMATVDGQEITFDEYLEFLFRRHDRSELRQLVVEREIERRARDIGVAVAEDRIARAVEEHITWEIGFRHRGDRHAFERSLERQLMTPEDYRRWQWGRLRTQLLEDAVIVASRRVQPDEVRARFQELYGEDGVLREVRVIALRESDPAHPVTELTWERARAITARLGEAPEQFAEIALEESTDELSRASGGLIPAYRPGPLGFGPAFDSAYAQLREPLQVVGPVESERAIYILQLVRASRVRFEDVRSEIRRQLQQRPAGPEERLAFEQSLLTDVRIEL